MKVMNQLTPDFIILEEKGNDISEKSHGIEEKKPKEVARRSSLVPERVLVTEKHRITVSRRLSVTFQPITLF